MTKEYFQNLLTQYYPDIVPISYLFKHAYSDRWFRIHSLPDSKRYADNENEWNILLSRQNEIITDLLGVDEPIFIITGDYNLGTSKTSYITDEVEVYKSYVFVRLDDIDLKKIDPEQYDEQDVYRPAFATTAWRPNSHDNLLREIANDNIRAFFVSFDKKVIVAPYDGGVDFVLNDSDSKDYYKGKYKQWLSGREDGL